ncbi:HD-GYP domain-containing protein [Silvimonas soli]|uniref:HD-GYP domain-containing protein n=1 Tax=Silvimonas soli TaxID=2980100 RepID=UPI0024B3937E|nr:HD domain-containing phosphohydrolase [Silvimonas soli]
MKSATTSDKATIMVVDDTPSMLEILAHLLEPDFRLLLASSGEVALALLAHGDMPDLILLDVEMDGLDGYLTCEMLKINAATRDVPVIFLTSHSDEENEARGFEVGAVDFITKPISPSTLVSRVTAQLALKRMRDLLRDKNTYLECEIARRTREVVAVQSVAIAAMASLAETRDSETGNHILRTQRYVKALAEHLRDHPRFSAQLDDYYIDLLFKSAPLHDIGKVGIPDHILLKPGKLTPQEMEIMKTHAVKGRAAIAKMEQMLGYQIEFLVLAKEIAFSHHEKWDGSGYPLGLSGDGVPLSARLMALADVYDALISPRVYKKPMSHEAASNLILAGRGTHFDPDIVDAFDQLQGEFQAIARFYGDTDAELEQKARLIGSLESQESRQA